MGTTALVLGSFVVVATLVYAGALWIGYQIAKHEYNVKNYVNWVKQSHRPK